MDSEISPRINGKHLGVYMGRYIVLIVENKGQNERGEFIATTSDGIDIILYLPPGEALSQRFVQVTGKVLNPTALEVSKLALVPDNFDMSNYDQLMTLASGQFRHLFFSS